MANHIPHIFIAYALKDKSALDKLRTHLNILQRRNLCRIFYDGEIKPGERWDKKLKDELHQADIFVLLVSEDFLDSDYINEVELPKILEKKQKGECLVIPVILRDCLWTWTELGELQAVLDNDRPIEETTGYGRAASAIAAMVSAHHEALKEQLAAIERQKQEAEEKKQRESEQRRQEKERQAAEAKLKKEAAEAARRRATDPFHGLMVSITGGIFQMGDEHGDLDEDSLPVHNVTVKGFQLCKFPVTQAQWQAIMGENPSYFKGCDDCPVESVSWDDVQTFLKKLNEKTGGNYRLPSEAEWEYAARGGTKSKKYKFAGSSEIEEVAWYGSNSGSKTHPVGGKKANELGLHDMSGNIWEWCADEWKSYPDSKKPFHEKNRRVVRGGSWCHDDWGCRVAYRYRHFPDFWYINVGFRLARY